MELLKKTAVEQHKALINKEVSAVELTNASIERIEKLQFSLTSMLFGYMALTSWII